MIQKTDECLICGELVPSVDEHSLPFCIDCAMSEMPKALAHAILTDDEADDELGCTFQNLQNAWTEAEKSFWKEAAYHLHHDGESGELEKITHPSLN